MAEKLPVIIGSWGDKAALCALQGHVASLLVEACQT